jgi:chromatin remodeling complex protein RSC6
MKKSKKEKIEVSEEDLQIPISKEKKKKATLESVMKDLEATILFVDNEIDKRKKTLQQNKGLSTFRNVKRNLEKIKKNLPKIAKKTRSRENIKNNFNTPVSISDELASFLGVEEGKKFKREDIICGIFSYINFKADEKRERMLDWKYLNSDDEGNPVRDLRSTEQKNIIIPDEKLSKILDYDSYVREFGEGNVKNKKGVSPLDDKLRFTVVVKLIQKHISK